MNPGPRTIAKFTKKRRTRCKACRKSFLWKKTLNGRNRVCCGVRCAATLQKKKKLHIDRDTLRDLWVDKGLSAKAICAMYGLSGKNGNSVQIAAKKLGVWRNERNPKRPELNRHAPKMKELYESGKTSEELAGIYKCSQDKILNLLHSAGCAMRRKGRSHSVTCTVVGCERPSFKKPWTNQGGMCRKHYQHRAAETARNSNRKLRNIPQEEWRTW